MLISLGHDVNFKLNSPQFMGFQGISWTKSGIAWLMVGTSLPYIYI